MQTLHLCFTFGSAFAAVICVPFLAELHLLIWPFLIISGIQVLAFLCLIPIGRQERIERQKDDPKVSEKGTEADELEKRLLVRRKHIMILSSLFLITYSGTRIIYMQFLPTFLQTSFSMSPESASILLSAVGYTSLFAKVMSILIGIRASPQMLIHVNLSIFISGLLFFMLLSGQGMALIWSANLLVGLGMSGGTGLLYAFLKRHVNITNVTGSLFVFCNGLTSTVTPLLVAELMTLYPMFLLHFTAVSTLVSIIIFASIHTIACKMFTEKSTHELNQIRHDS